LVRLQRLFPVPSDFFPYQRERSGSAASIQQWMLSADDRRSQYVNMQSVSMESAHSSSSRGSEAQQADKRGFGGSYSAATGCSSKVISNTLSLSAGQPKLAQVAAALLKAKAAGELPSALGDKAVVERKISQTQGQPGGVPPDVQQTRSVRLNELLRHEADPWLPFSTRGRFEKLVWALIYVQSFSFFNLNLEQRVRWQFDAAKSNHFVLVRVRQISPKNFI
jgi:hypothetical protein